MARALLVLDLDGTLVDTCRDLVPALNAVTALDGLPPVRMDDVGHIVGHGARAMIARAYELYGRALDEATHERLFTEFLARYGARIADESRPFPGAAAMLGRFAAAGWSLAVCTNKPERLSRLLLGALLPDHGFAAVSGGDTFAVRKPHPDHLLGTIRTAGGAAQAALFVGDSATDVDTARAAGVPVAGVTFGYASVPMAALAPDLLIDHFDQLTPAAATRLIAGASPGRFEGRRPA